MIWPKQRKTLIWVGSSRKDFLSFSEDTIDIMGYALHIAQMGQRHNNSKPLKGFGNAGIIEIIDTQASGTYRTVYTVIFDDYVFVLHAFQKKSKEGIKTPQRDIDLIHTRLAQARKLYNEILKKDMQ